MSEMQDYKSSLSDTSSRKFETFSYLPEMSKEQVFNRVKSLIMEPEYADPLPVLAEVNYYFARQLLPENAYVAAVGRLIGKENSTRFAKGTPPEPPQPRTVSFIVPPCPIFTAARRG